MALEPLEPRQLLAGAWTDLANPAPPQSNGIGTMLLLTDGTVLAEGAGPTNTWFKLTPDATGSYVDGTWSQLASMGTDRLYFGSDVLQNGKVVVLGGEYSGPQGAENLVNTGEIYDPVKNTWTAIANFPDTNFGDDPTTLLPNGNILAGDPLNASTYIYNPSTDTWAQAATKLDQDQSDEESWVKLPDGSILTYDVFAPGKAQRYIPSKNQWVETGPTPPLPLTSAAVGYELGAGFLLPDGRAFYLGATGHTAYYTPSTNSWAQGPDIPSGLGTDDAAAAELPNGKILLAADVPLFDPKGLGTSYFEFDPTTNKYTLLTPSVGLDLTNPAYTSRTLMLPTGQVLVSSGGSQLSVYTPDSGAPAAVQPTVTSVVQNKNGTFTLTGTQLNGVSIGAAYGDDVEVDTNYPIVRLQDASGNVYYARTTNWSNTGASTGAAPETVLVTMPGGANPARPPVVTAESPAGAIENQPFSNVEVATFVDPTGAHPIGNYSATIDWGDGSSGAGTITGPNADGSFSVDGSHLYTLATNHGVRWTITVTVTEDYQLTEIGSGIPSQPYDLPAIGVGTVAAALIDPPPVVTPVAGLTGVEGQSTGNVAVATFIDPAGNLLASQYAATIDWGDGSTSAGAITYDSTSQTFAVNGAHTYTEEGVYAPAVTVQDLVGSRSGLGVDTATITDAPLAPLSATFTSTEGKTYSNVVGQFTDANPTAPVTDFTAVIAWGDGSVTFGTIKKSSSGAFNVSGTHAYGEEGSYRVNVLVSDDGGATTPIVSTAQIVDAPLTATGGTVTAVEGQAVAPTTTVATFVDAYSAAPVSDFTATIDWGDGTTTAGTVGAMGNGHFSVLGGVPYYAENGTYPLAVTISDRGGSTTTVVGTANITDAPLTATGGAIQGMEGQPTPQASLATFTDGDTYSRASDFTATVDWGDGLTSAATVIALSDGNYAVTGSHEYAQAAPYTVDVTIADRGGQSVTATTSAAITDSPLVAGAPRTIAPIVGQAFSGAVATFTDPNPNAAPSDFVASIDWGDGTTTPATLTPSSTPPAGGGVTFTVQSTSSHAYHQVTVPGQPGEALRVLIVDLGGARLTTSGVADVADAPITAAAGSAVQAVEGASVSGVVATFTDGNPYAQVSDFTATIDWGDGSVAAGTVALASTSTTSAAVGSAAAGSVTPASAAFTVTGAATYAEEGQYPIRVTISDRAGTTAQPVTTQANITDAPLRPGASQSVSPVAGVAFTGTLATFTDTYPDAPFSDFTATINWGDGSPVIAGAAMISQPGGTGTPLVVAGTHTYANAAAAVPISITIDDAGGSAITMGATAHVQVPLVGSLSPSSITTRGGGSPSQAISITSNAQPTFSGRAEPGDTVRLTANGAIVGGATANSFGQWGIVSHALGDGTYAFAAQVLAPGSNTVIQTVPLSGPVLIDTTGPTVAGISLDAATQTLHVTFHDAGSGLNLPGVTYLGNYLLQLQAGTGVITFQPTGLSVTPGPAGSGDVTANISYNLGRPVRAGGYVVTIQAPYITDLAGNSLVERTYVTFPQTTNAPNANYVAQIGVGSALASSPPQVYIPRSERLAANRFASRVHPRPRFRRG